MKLYILKYNNYFNRKLLKLDNISDYEQYVVLTADNISFNPNDGRQTTQILNKYESGDYLICTETKDEVESIVSRWFILEANRTRQGQYNLSLKRDVLADNLDSILAAPMFVEKAMLKDTDKMIVNNEGMQFNQIKSNEILLKDKSNCPWIVGYVAKNFGGDKISTDVDISLPGDTVKNYFTLSQIATATGIDENILASNLILPGETSGSKPIYFNNRFKLEFDASDKSEFFFYYQCDLWFDAYCHHLESKAKELAYSSWDRLLKNSNTTISTLMNRLGSKISSMSSDIVSQLKSTFSRSYFLNTDELGKLKQYNGKTIYYLGSYYKLNVNALSYKNETKSNVNPASQFGAISTAIKNANYPNGTTIDLDAKIRLTLQDVLYELKAESLEGYTVTGKISSSRNVIASEAFDMFVMPYNDILFDYQGETFIASGELSNKIASDMATRFDAQCYDIQLLPYCPVPDMLDSYGEINTDNLIENQDYNLLKAEKKQIKTSYTVSGNMTYDEVTDEYVRTIDMSSLVDFKLVDYKQTNPKVISITDLSVVTVNGKVTIVFKADSLERANEVIIELDYTYTMTDYPVGIILYPTKNDFKVTLNYSLSLTHSMKVESQVDTYRLCSPNYQGSFDFNVAKNGGKVECFYADCTYKPYTPYIRVYPKFDWLYGNDYGDCRGLICGGDFSLPRVNDAWASYQLNNKNYQNIFNRDIQNLDFNNSIAMRNQAFSAISGVVSDTAKGAASGAMMGGVWGAAAGAIVGGATSTVGAIIDTDTLARQQREQKQLSIDKYNYQLGNIQALPYTLTKVGAFDINSKLYPFIEYYTASDEEVKTLEDKITYESMTVMRIGTISEFKQEDPTYIKGQLIRLDDFHEDTNLVNDIYTELYKGVYY